MARHARNNTASAVFTHYEKSRLNYGTKKQRLGKDSLRDLDSCCLCLKPVVNPLSCLKGHIFCKECIYENLLTQKQEIKRLTKIWQAQQDQLTKEKEENELKQKEEEETHAMRYIISPVSTIEGKSQSRALVVAETKEKPTETTTTKTTSQYARTFSTADGKSYDINGEYKDPVVKKAQFEALEELKQAQEESKSLKSFWVATQTPSARAKPMEKPNQIPQCTEGAPHPIRLKDLIPVHFTPVPNIDDTDPNQLKNGRYQCPICLKTITNSTKSTLIRTCGHVVCTTCLAAFVSSEKKCYVCNVPCDINEFIQLQAGGTGYSAHGESLEAKKYTSAAWV